MSKDSAPRYDLSVEELAEVEELLVQAVLEDSPESGISAAWIRPDHPFANVIRCKEARLFPEVVEVLAADEERSLFLALVDTRPDERRAIHAGTVSGSRALPNTRCDHSSGMITVDSLIEMGNFSLEEFRDYYRERGLNLETCIAVETNFRIGRKAKPWKGLDSTHISYYIYFTEVLRQGGELGTFAIFATLNRPQINSLRRIGLKFEPLMGRENMETPEEALGVETMPVVFYDDPTTHQLLAAMDIGLHEMWF